MNILVTGGAGYIGSHTVRALLSDGHQVTVLDNLSKGHKESVSEGVVLVRADLEDREKLAVIFAKGRFDAVVHFAGSIEVGLSMKDPGLFIRNNVMNGVNLLEAMRVAGVKKIIFSSTAAVYGNPDVVPIKEDSKLAPTNFYGISKLMFENLLSAYERDFGFNYAALRYFNAAGADSSGLIGQDYSPDTHLIPRILKTLLGKYEFVEIFGIDYKTPDGTCVRDYIHVSDLADAHVKALDYVAGGAGAMGKNGRQRSGVFNLGNGNGFSVREVIKAAEKVTGKKVPVRASARREGDPAVLVADSTRARKVLGWKPKYSDLESIVGSAWKWHSAHPRGYADAFS
jgi:UDP-glucose 4-epimerase